MKFTIEDKLKIIELREQGMGYSAIAKQFDVQYSTIRRMLSRYELHGLEGIKHPFKNRKYSAEFKLEVINRAYQGESKSSLSVEYNLPGKCTIISWIKKYEELGYNGLEGKQGRPRGRPKIMIEEKKKNTPLTNDEREELIRLRKEKEYLEMENEVLKN